MSPQIINPILKYFIFILMLFGLCLNTYAQNLGKNNFFTDIKSIDLSITLDGDFNFCKVSESDIRSTVGYILANSPLKKIDKNSLDILQIGVVILNTKNDRGVSLGCTAAINVELRRPTNFKGIFSYVSVWSGLFLQLGTDNSMSRQINSVVERSTKEFVVKWSEQN